MFDLFAGWLTRLPVNLPYQTGSNRLGRPRGLTKTIKISEELRQQIAGIFTTHTH